MKRLRRGLSVFTATTLMGFMLAATPAATLAQGDAELWLVRSDMFPADPDAGSRFFNGELVTWAVEVVNRGPADATNVTSVHTLDPALFFVASESDPRCAALGQTVTCALGTIPGASGIASEAYLIRVRPSATGERTSSISVQADQPDPNPSNNSDTETITVLPAADLAVTVSDSPDPVRNGGNVTYLVTVANNGPDPSTEVELRATWWSFDSEITFVGLSSSQGTCVHNPPFEYDVVVCDDFTLNVGETMTLSVTLSARVLRTGRGELHMLGDVHPHPSLSEFPADLVANNQEEELTEVLRRPAR